MLYYSNKRERKLSQRAMLARRTQEVYQWLI